jgi:hypothetical protein
MSRRYDSRTTIFSPEGRLYQVEYAMEAISNAGAAIGCLAKDGVVLIAEKKITSKVGGGGGGGGRGGWRHRRPRGWSRDGVGVRGGVVEPPGGAAGSTSKLHTGPAVGACSSRMQRNPPANPHRPSPPLQKNHAQLLDTHAVGVRREKMYKLDEHIACAVAGMTGARGDDGRRRRHAVVHICSI